MARSLTNAVVTLFLISGLQAQTYSNQTLHRRDEVTQEVAQTSPAPSKAADNEPWSVCVVPSDPRTEVTPIIDNAAGGTKAQCDAVKGLWNPVRATLQGVITPAQQAAYPENAWMKPCGPTNHDDWCVDMSAAPAPEKAASPPERRTLVCEPSSGGGWDCELADSQMDVPPITETYWQEGMVICMETCPAPQTSATPVDGWVEHTRPSCADKARFLMTAEDGSKHCLALSPQPKGGSK